MLLLHKYEPSNIHDLLHEDNIVNILDTFVKNKFLNILIVGDEDTGKTTIVDTIINECLDSNFININDIYKINNFQINTFIDYLTKVKTFCSCNANEKKPKFVVLENLDFYTENNQQFIKNVIQSSRKNISFIVTSSCINNIIEPIQSSLFNLFLHGFNKDKFVSHFYKISKNENLNLLNKDVRDICIKFKYNYTSVISYFEHLKLSNDIASHTFSLVNPSTFDKYFTYCKLNNIDDAYGLLNTLYDSGFNTIDILDEIYKYVKNNDMYTNLSPILCKYINDFSNGFDDVYQLFFFTHEICKLLVLNN